MKLLLIILFIAKSSFALNETMLNMPKNSSYMNFVMKRYLSWHREHFKFPENKPLVDELLLSTDHWLVDKRPYRQISFTHTSDDKGQHLMRLKIFIRDDLREKSAFKGPGLPNKDPWFYEVDSSGRVCLSLLKSPEHFEVWCKEKNSPRFNYFWDESLTQKLPTDWPVPFPFLGETFIVRTKGSEVLEVDFFQVSPHPSRMPRPLLRPVYLNTKDPLFPLDRVSTKKDGRMSVHYP